MGLGGGFEFLDNHLGLSTDFTVNIFTAFFQWYLVPIFGSIGEWGMVVSYGFFTLTLAADLRKVCIEIPKIVLPNSARHRINYCSGISTTGNTDKESVEKNTHPLELRIKNGHCTFEQPKCDGIEKLSWSTELMQSG